MMRSQVLFIGGRSGVGKTTAAIALHDRYRREGVRHAVIEGDFLDLAHPAPHLAFPDEHLAEQNLRGLWSNYRRLGYRRLVYTNTAAVLFAGELAAAMGDDPEVTTVLLRAGDPTVLDRLTARGVGSIGSDEVDHSAATAARLDADVSDDVHRLDTDGRTPAEVADRLAVLLRWAPEDRSALSRDSAISR